MRVFISHTFTNEDKALSSTLQNILEERGIIGYLAEKRKKYDLLIRDKIKKEIERSDYLVAVITNKAKESASVNQEIGYALGKNVPIIIMLEKKAKLGVLTHGIESEEFSKPNFKSSCINIRKYILKKGPRKQNKQTASREEGADTYDRYSSPQKIVRLKKDVQDSFESIGFRIKKIKILRKLDWRDEPEEYVLDVAENSSTKQRFFLFYRNDNFLNHHLNSLYRDIDEFVYPSIKESRKWLSSCVIFNVGSVNKSTIEKFYQDVYRYSRQQTNQNTTIQIDSSMHYYGLGEIGGFQIRHASSWLFYSSMPKFFISRLKLKNEVLTRLGNVLDFIDSHPKIFKNVIIMKQIEKKYRPPREDRPIIKTKVLKITR